MPFNMIGVVSRGRGGIGEKTHLIFFLSLSLLCLDSEWNFYETKWRYFYHGQ